MRRLLPRLTNNKTHKQVNTNEQNSQKMKGGEAKLLHGYQPSPLSPVVVTTESHLNSGPPILIGKQNERTQPLTQTTDLHAPHVSLTVMSGPSAYPDQDLAAALESATWPSPGKSVQLRELVSIFQRFSHRVDLRGGRFGKELDRLLEETQKLRTRRLSRSATMTPLAA